MYASHDRGATREVFFRAWRKHLDHAPLEGVEQLLVQVALRHPEYHALLDNRTRHLERDFSPLAGETNPFLHMGLHIAIEEQLSLDEPRGIRAVYQTLRTRHPDDHAAQHAMMECLGEWLHRAQQQGGEPNLAIYMECLTRLTGAPR